MSKAWMPILAGAMLLGASGAAVAKTHDAKSMDMAGNMVEGVMHMTPDARASIGVIGDHTLKQAFATFNRSLAGSDRCVGPARV